MKVNKLLIYFIFVFFLFFASIRTSALDTRYATCDACGFCPTIINNPPGCGGVTPPGNWKECVRCLYPSIYPTNTTPNSALCESLIIEPTANLAPTTFRGRQYTMIGCITSEGGFQNNTGSGASSFTQALFDLVVFKMIGGIALLYLMYGAFLIITSQADPEKLNHGKRVLYGSIIGLIFVLSSVLLVNIIGSNILRLPGFISITPTPPPAGP